MKYAFFIPALLAIGLSTYSCNKREIIPAPEPKVDLEVHFYGKIDGTDIELTQNVNGYTGSSDADFIITASSIDSAIYYSTMASNQSLLSITVGHGSIPYDANTSSRPSLAQFESFYTSHLQPDVTFDGRDGFVIIYKDALGKTWKSNDLGAFPAEDVLYTVVEKESDESGDYIKFKVNFETMIYHTYYDEILEVDVTEEMLITDAVYTGWYKR